MTVDHIFPPTCCLTEQTTEIRVISQAFLFLVLDVNRVLYPISEGTDTFF